MFSVMDSTEAQLKFGAYLTNYTDPTHPLHPLNLSVQNNTSQTNTGSGGGTGTAVGINILGMFINLHTTSLCETMNIIKTYLVLQHLHLDVTFLHTVSLLCVLTHLNIETHCPFWI